MRVAGIPVPERSATDPATEDEGLEEGEEEANMEDDPEVEVDPLPNEDLAPQDPAPNVVEQREVKVSHEPVAEGHGAPMPKELDELVAIAQRPPKLRRMVAEGDPKSTKSADEAPEEAASSKGPSEQLAAMPNLEETLEGARAMKC